MFAIWWQRRQARAAAAPASTPGLPAEQRFPVGIVTLHGLLAVTTVVLVFLAAIGVCGRHRDHRLPQHAALHRDDLAREGGTRRIDADLLRDHLEDELGDFTYLVAGPPAMVEAMENTLREAAVPEEQVCPERFSGYTGVGGSGS